MKSVLISATALLTLSAFSPALAQSGYEVWASDQSNSVSDAASPGTEGSWLWIWDSDDIETQLSGGPDAQAIGCGKNNGGKSKDNVGPCDLKDVFPQDLVEMNADGEPTGNVLSDLSGFGRLHGMIQDPQNRYVTANIFAPGGGYVGIIDTETKGAIALFRVTGTNVNGGTDVRSVHMSFWNNDGSAILIANLNGKLLERIDITRNGSGKIKSATFNRSASLGVGKSMAVTTDATYFAGKNAQSNNLLGSIIGSYDEADLGDLTPNDVCRENGCESGEDGAAGGRPNNVIICPIATSKNHAYVTMGAGGLIVADADTTPMTILGEYGNEVINGAGCGGIEVNEEMWINAGVSASGAGATQSTFTVYSIDDPVFESGPQGENLPAPAEVFKDLGNTSTIGNLAGQIASNDTGQLPGITTRRDAHGAVETVNGSHIHMVDRIQNVVEVFDTVTYGRTTYDLTSADGQGEGEGPCAAKSVSDDPELPGNDPAPDLMEVTPDGKYMMIAFRGPRPVSVGHSAQGSCPGVGIVEVTENGASGRLVGVLRSSNPIDTSGAGAPGGHAYTGTEHSDVHGATVVRKGVK